MSNVIQDSLFCLNNFLGICETHKCDLQLKHECLRYLQGNDKNDIDRSHHHPSSYSLVRSLKN